MNTNTVTNSTSLNGLMVAGKNILKVSYKMLRKVTDWNYEKYDTDQQYFVTYEMKGSRSARKTDEGSDSFIDSLSDGGQKRVQIENYTIGFNFTRQMLQFNLYSAAAPQILKNLLMSQIDCLNTVATAPMNNAFSNAPQYLGWDNKPIASNFHVVDGNNAVSNTLLVPAPTNESTIWELITKMVMMQQPSGLKLDSLYPVGIMANPVLIRQLKVLMNSPTRPGFSSMELNPTKDLFQDFYINRYLQSNLTIIRTNEEGWRFPMFSDFEIGQNPWYSSFTILIASSMQYACFIDQFRSTFGASSAPVGNQ
jgi:hypothetical protein